MRAPLLAASTAFAALLSCSAPAPSAVTEAPLLEDLAPAPVLRLPAEWDRCSRWEFERRVADLGRGRWEDEELVLLARALDEMEARSDRAAVLLAHGSEGAREVLLSRLEARVEGPRRDSDAADVVAARALAAWADADTLTRLTELAVGPAPHPDLEVRVECAAVALELGQDQVTDFLLRVLTAGTPAEREYGIDWRPTETLAWAKGRASAALSARAGLPNRFLADGPYSAQIELADELRRRLAAP